MKIQWHAGFVSAIELELAENKADLVYEREHNLNKKPLEIDLLVIKKNDKVQVENKIGKLFRKYNIVEYKSPKDHLNIDTFFKAAAYACLYKAYGKTVDERRVQDITVSLVRQIRPAGLFQYFADHGIRFTNPYNGIYYVMDGVLFPTQIIVTKELNPKEHLWMRALSGGMQKQQMKALLEKIESFDTNFERELADSVLEVTVRANWETVQELRGDDRMCQALLELMEPEINKIKREAEEEAQRKGMQKGIREGMREGMQKGMREGMQKGIEGTVTALRDCGQKEAAIKDAIMRVYNLTSEEAERYL